MSAIRRHTASVLYLFLIVSFFLFSQWCEILYGDDSLRTGHESLIDKYHKIENELGKSPFDIPFYVESSVSNNTSYVDIYGTIKYPFDIVQNELQVPTNCYNYGSYPPPHDG